MLKNRITNILNLIFDVKYVFNVTLGNPKTSDFCTRNELSKNMQYLKPAVNKL